MTKYTAPPSQFDLVLNKGDQLIVGASGHAVHITINAGGEEIVDSGGLAIRTTINNGGVEDVNVLGRAFDTQINARGVLNVESGGLANNVTFGTIGGTLELQDPMDLKGIIKNWRVGDRIDFTFVDVTGATVVGDKLTVTYGNDRKAIYTLAGQQADTHVTFHPDGNHGTDLVLVVGQAAQIETLHHLA